MKRLDDREQRYAYTGGALAAVVSLLLWAPKFDEGAAVALSAIGLVMAGLLAVAAKRRHRLFTGLASILLAFGPWGMAWVVGLPFLMLAAWLSLRSGRLQPRLEPELDENGEIVHRPARPVRARPRRRRRSPSGSEAVTDGDQRPGRRPPTQSKRYTPPQRPR